MKESGSDCKKIYVVTTIEFGYKYGDTERHEDGLYHSYGFRTSPDQEKIFTKKRSSTWGWFDKLEDAQESVRENWGDMYEGCYNYAVIEEVGKGILNHGMKEWWYKWKGSWEQGGYKKSKKPKQYSNVIGFWGG